MWLFTTIGFYSVTTVPGQPGMMQIRARAKADLQRLIDATSDDWRQRWATECLEIIETPEADYRWRVLMSQGQWIDVAELLADAIDYENFKDAAHETQSDKPLMAIWSAMADYQKRAWLNRERTLSKDQYDDFGDERFFDVF